MTEETLQSSELAATDQAADQNVIPDAAKTKEGKKEKCRPLTKVVIRRLPPSMTQEQFMEQVSPLPEHDFMYFAKADMSLGQNAFSRAYIDFLNQQDIFEFREKFDNYVFVDSKGTEFAAVVEFAPFQRVPKKRIGKKKDIKCGTIESDPYYISFLESLKSQETESSNAAPKTEYSFQPSDHTPKKVTSTPLLDFLKQRKQEKQRIKDEKREEKRRRDFERKRGKDEVTFPRVIKNNEDDDQEKDREVNRENKENKDDKDKILQKDFKNRTKKDDKFRDKPYKDFREIKTPGKTYKDRDDRGKGDFKQNKKIEDRRFSKKDEQETLTKEQFTSEKEETNYKDRKFEEKRGKSYEKMRLEKKKLVDTQKKQNIQLPVKDSYVDQEASRDEGEGDNKYHKSNSKDTSEVRGQYKNKKYIERSRNNSGTTGTNECNESSTKLNSDEVAGSKSSQSISQKSVDKLQEICDRFAQSSLSESNNGEIKSPRIAKRRNSLGSGGDSGTITKSSGGSSKGDNSNDQESYRSSLRRYKSLDGGDDNKLEKNELDDKEKDKKDPRLERRIRNKDRPAMEIYRPGMGRFSKQRMEREKGSDDRATSSQSPTPSSSSALKPGKPSVSEVRSMTFKRSAGRDTT
ncbi:hypothetical protein QAD02_019355 [Eretmocerus hayati]|uniref:Uncharacterized protein n=1 Tax=Eretmocerus hayati TaxID=131215 RepID=A0ACC2PKI0_9HYME|nr:hypothetical protein QAD02_019355 [Eretmocerus hayati]